MSRNRTALLVALPLLAACSDSHPTTISDSALMHRSPAAAVAASAVRPAGGTCEADVTIRPSLPGDAPNVLRLHIEALCQLKHLGRTTGVAEQVVIFTGPTTAIASNIATYTAANGDKLYAVWNGTSTSVGTETRFSGPETYTGGTGRFVGASGTALVNGTASSATNTGRYTTVGTISY